MTKTLFALVLCLVLSPLGFSQIYKWKDKDGNIVVSTTPPPPGVVAETRKVEKTRPAPPKADNAARVEPGAQVSEFKRPYGDIKVVMYVTDWCPYCHKASAFLKSLGVRLVEYDVEKDAERNKEWRRKAPGGSGVPVIDVEGVILRGFDPGKIRAAVEAKRIF